MDKQNKEQPKQGNNEEKRKQMDKNMPDSSKPGKSSDPHKTAKHQEASEADDDEPVGGGNNDPDKSPEIGDDPETTKKKIPNMHK